MIEIKGVFGVTIIVLSMTVLFVKGSPKKVYVSNLHPQCLQCLCHTATECDIGRLCQQGYCGPYKISRIYWKDAGQVVLPDDDPERAGAFEDCAYSVQCAQRIVVNYIARFGSDCNGDGVTDCEDFMMTNFNGGYYCDQPLNRSETGREWLQRFKTCNSFIVL